MTKVLVLYYSAYGHIEAMANAVAEGAREAGATVDVKRVPELVPAEVAKASYYKVDQAAPVAKIEDLANYDAIIVGTGTRFGRMASQMATSSIRPAGSGPRARCTARSAAPSRPPRPSMAARRRRCSRSSPTSCISAWSWSA
ncbi:flavodoxin [Bradyrhizobium ottawaense]